MRQRKKTMGMSCWRGRLNKRPHNILMRLIICVNHQLSYCGIGVRNWSKEKLKNE